MRWTVKDAEPGEAFAFWPGDVAGAFGAGRPHIQHLSDLMPPDA
jgi:hypothetical protein